MSACLLSQAFLLFSPFPSPWSPPGADFPCPLSLSPSLGSQPPCPLAGEVSWGISAASSDQDCVASSQMQVTRCRVKRQLKVGEARWDLWLLSLERQAKLIPQCWKLEISRDHLVLPSAFRGVGIITPKRQLRSWQVKWSAPNLTANEWWLSFSLSLSLCVCVCVS